MVSRIIRIVVSPRAEWPRVAAEGAAAAALYAAALCLVPALAAAAMRSVSELPLPEHSVAATYGFCLASIVFIAAAFWALTRMHAVRASWASCLKVAAYGATPLWLASALLFAPVLVIVCMISALHAFYLYYTGAQILLGVPQGESALFVALSLTAAVVATTLAGGAVAALGLL